MQTGQRGKVTVNLSDKQTFKGLKAPHTVETQGRKRSDPYTVDEKAQWYNKFKRQFS